MHPLLDVVVRPWEDHRLWVVMCLHIQSGIDTSPKWLGLTETLERHPMRCLKTYGLYHLYMAYHLLAACCQNHTFVACEALSIYKLGRLSQSSKAISPIHFTQELSPNFVKSFRKYPLHQAAYTTLSCSSSYTMIQRQVTFPGSQDNSEYIGIWHFP